MKTTALILTLALASCGPIDPATGIRQDAPTSWQGQPNPLDTPGVDAYRIPPSMGSFGPGWLDR